MMETLFLTHRTGGVAKVFYTDSVISNLEPLSTTGTYCIVSARIDGREIKKLGMSNEMFHYFTGVGKGTQNRVWFYRTFGNLFIGGIENAAGERLQVKEKTGMKLYSLFIRPACAGFLFWFLSWVVLTIPVTIYAYQVAANSWKGPFDLVESIINPIGIYGGIAVAIWLFVSFWNLYEKLDNLDPWPAGDVSVYTKAVKPAFGAGLAALKK